MIDLKPLHTDYREKVAAVQDETISPEARALLEPAMVEARHTLDAAIVANDAERADLDRAAAVERAADISHRAAKGAGIPDVVAEQRKAVREFMTPGSTRNKLTVPFPSAEARATTDIITTDAGTTYASYVVPTSIMDRVVYHANAESGVLQCNVTTIYTAGGNTIYVPTLTTDAAASTSPGTQGGAATQTDFVLAHPQLDSYRIDGWFGVATEFLDDAIIDAEQFLGDLAGRAIASQIATYAASGTGSSQPQGVNDTTEITGLGVTSASATSFTYDDLIDLRYSVLPAYGARGEWVFGDAAFVILVKMKDDSGQYYHGPGMFQASSAPGSPDTLMGKNCFADAGYQAVTSAKAPVTFGDMSNYWVRWSRGGIEFTRDDSFAFTSFEVTYRFAAWWDAELLHPTIAVKHLLTAT